MLTYSRAKERKDSLGKELGGGNLADKTAEKVRDQDG